MKKGDLDNLCNYRPITIRSQIFKTFTLIILNRMAKDLDMLRSKEQAAFHEGHSTIDHINATRQLTEKHKRASNSSLPYIR